MNASQRRFFGNISALYGGDRWAVVRGVPSGSGDGIRAPRTLMVVGELHPAYVYPFTPIVGRISAAGTVVHTDDWRLITEPEAAAHVELQVGDVLESVSHPERRFTVQSIEQRPHATVAEVEVQQP